MRIKLCKTHSCGGENHLSNYVSTLQNRVNIVLQTIKLATTICVASKFTATIITFSLCDDGGFMTSLLSPLNNLQIIPQTLPPNYSDSPFDNPSKERTMPSASYTY
jgi:hypothetical protein